ncbi:MAG: hypothetical protein M1823_005987 [Watsoniomyces obsoletus]|nr:MAG: hypothetical protein M1823_005987 [Watsoniomyces obsoletus]
MFGQFELQAVQLASSSHEEKPYYVTTPIFYVNAPPHIGHLYTLILADILKGWQVLRGRKAILCTGIDEHGTKVQQAAALAKIETQTFCDQASEVYKVCLAQRANISNDHFVRTTDPKHRDVVQHVWLMLQERGYIYKSTHVGWYAVADEAFYPESGVHLIKDPRTGKTMMTCRETGAEVERVSEPNYFFRLDAFRDDLLKFYSENPNFITPELRMKETIQQVTAGLQDLSISRPSDRLSWGIRVPGDESQTIYVWIDALINYLTKAGYPWAPGEGHRLGWPADVHVVGKEIVKFHCIYWPALLMALGISPPKQVLAHAHWTLGYRKMSKTIGNVVDPFFALDRFGTDAMRYYMAHEGGIRDDSDYGNTTIIARYNGDLKGGLGNLVSRVVRGKQWNVRDVVRKHFAGKHMKDDPIDAAHRSRLKQLSKRVNKEMEQLNIAAALKTIIEVVYATNKYMQHRQPWDTENETGNGPDRRELTIYLIAETLRICGILLQPFIPERASRLLDMLGVHASRRTFAHANLHQDDSYGNTSVELGTGYQSVLFPPLRSEA